MSNLGDARLVKLAGAWQKMLVANQWPAKAAAHLVLVVLVLHLWEVQLGKSSLQLLCESDALYRQLRDRWQAFCEQTDWEFLSFLPPDSPVGGAVSAADALLKSILGSLYYPDPDRFITVSAGVLGLVYEQGLATGESGLKSRKSGGIYYTPQSIVNYLVQTTLGSALMPSNPQMLDPACGGGAFLLAAYQYLLNNSQTNRSNPCESDPYDLLSHIHGVDLDSNAVAITQISLWLQAAPESHHSRQAFALLQQNIRCGNAVIDAGASGLNWQRTFPEIMAAGGFDLVIGNPPYMDAELMSTEYPDWRAYCTRHYRTATGNWDLFCIFIERALQLCCTGGLTSLVVPNKLLSAGYAAATRQLLSCNQLQSIRDYSNIAVFDAAVHPIVYIVQKTSQNSTVNLYYEKMLTVEQVEQAHWLSLNPGQDSWPVTNSSLMQRLEQLPKLGNFLGIVGAATVAEAYSLSALIQNCSVPQPADLRLVNSGTIDRYRCLWGQKRLRYLGQTYQHPVVPASVAALHLPLKRLRQAQQPKIIVAGMSLRLECMVDQTGGILAGKSASVITLATGPAAPEAIDLRYWLGLLNSRLLSFYLLNRFGGNQLQGGYLRIGPPQLRHLPAVLPTADQAEHMIGLVAQRMALNHAAEQVSIQSIDAKIDAAVYQIYRLSDLEIVQVEALAMPDF